MKIVIGLIVVVGLGWLLLSGGEPDATPADTTDGEVMEENGAMEEGDAAMEEGEGDATMEEGDTMEAGADVEVETDASAI